MDLLREREKELDTLYLMAELCARSGLGRRELLEEAAAVLRGAFQMPRGVRIVITYCGILAPAGAEVPSGAACLRAAVPGASVPGGDGEITAFYTDPRPAPPEFLDRERLLLESIGKLLGETLRRIRAERRIRRQNTALREVIVHAEGEKRRLLRKTRLFIEGRALPLLAGVLEEGPEGGRTAVRRLREVLESLPGSVDLESQLEGFSLSPRELELCGLLRAGMSSKEIASFLGLSELTVERHRHNIRRKLGIGKEVSLAAHLMYF